MTSLAMCANWVCELIRLARRTLDLKEALPARQPSTPKCTSYP